MKTHDEENEELVTAYEHGWEDALEKAAEIAKEEMDDQSERLKSEPAARSFLWAAYDGGQSSSESIYNLILSLKQSKDVK